MILADIFPVFCPRVLVPSSSPWTRYSSQPDNRYGKMWSGSDNSQLSKDQPQTPRQYPNLIPIPDKLYFDRRDAFRLFSDSSFKGRPRNTSIFSETSAFRSSQLSQGIPKLTPFLEPDKSQLSFQSPAPGFLHISQSFQQPSSITESLLRSPGATLQSTLFKRRDELGESLHCPRPKSQVSSPVIRLSPFCSSRAVGLYRKQSSAGSQNKKLYTCPQCKYVTDRKNNLKRHISTMHQDSAKILECCGMVFRSKALLRDHVSLFHRAGYRCQYCGRNFCRKALLRRHLTVHSGQKDFTCPQCGYATSHKSNLERHRKIHDRKFSMNGEVFSDDTDSNDMSHYMDVISSPSTSSESSPTASHTKYTHSSHSGDSTCSHLRTHRNAMQDGITETHGAGETTGVTEPYIHTTLPASISDGFTSSVYSTVQLHASGLGGGISRPLPMNNQATSDSLNSGIKFNDAMGRFSSKFMLDGRERKSSNRLFLNPYKCCDCTAVFSQQKLFNRHTCRSENRVMLSPPISVVERKHKQAEQKHGMEVKKETMPVNEKEFDVFPREKSTTDDSSVSHSIKIPEVDIIIIDAYDVIENVDKEDKSQ